MKVPWTRIPPRPGLDGVNEDGNLPFNGRELQRERERLSE